MLLEPKSPRNSRSATLTSLPARSVWWSTWKLDPATTVNKETTKLLNGAGADLEAGKALMAQFAERGVGAARCVNKTEHSQLIAHNVSIFRALGGVLAVSTKMEVVATGDDDDASSEEYAARLAKALPPHAPLMPRRFPDGIPSAAKPEFTDGHAPLLDTRAAIAAEMAMLREGSDLTAEEATLRHALHELDALHEMIEKYERASRRTELSHAKVISPPDAPSSLNNSAPSSPQAMRVILEDKTAEGAAAAGVKEAWPAPHPSGVPSYDSTIDMNLDAAREALEAVGEA